MSGIARDLILTLPDCASHRIGQTQPRVVKIEGDYLYLQTASPIESGGKKVNSYLKWKRAKKN